MTAEYLSFGAGLFLLAVSIMVMKAYWPSTRGEVHWLGLAIFLGFAAAAGNTFWWQILALVNTETGFVPREQFRAVGWWFDVLFKGGAGCAGILHLVALQRQIPKKERPMWHWWDMPWYPKRQACITKLFKLFGVGK